MFIEKTLSTQNVIVPNWTPFQQINFCASRSLSSDIESVAKEQTDTLLRDFTTLISKTSRFSFFVFMKSSLWGVLYESIESLIIKQKMVGDLPIYQYAPKLTESKSGNLFAGYFRVEQ